jgi:hypothetical protein
MRSDEIKEPGMENGDWTEELFCAECEDWLNIRYETSQIAFLRAYKNIHKYQHKITFKNFNYEKFYLFLLSIFWRASISSLPDFSNVRLGDGLEQYIRRVLVAGSISKEFAVLPDLLKIGIIRLVDDRQEDESIMRGYMTSFILESDHPFIYHLVLDGFLISYMLVDDANMEMPRELGPLKRSFLLKVPRVQINDSARGRKIFEHLVEVASQYPRSLG